MTVAHVAPHYTATHAPAAQITRRTRTRTPASHALSPSRAARSATHYGISTHSAVNTAALRLWRLPANQELSTLTRRHCKRAACWENAAHLERRGDAARWFAALPAVSLRATCARMDSSPAEYLLAQRRYHCRVASGAPSTGSCPACLPFTLLLPHLRKGGTCMPATLGTAALQPAAPHRTRDTTASPHLRLHAGQPTTACCLAFYLPHHIPLCRSSRYFTACRACCPVLRKVPKRKTMAGHACHTHLLPPPFMPSTTCYLYLGRGGLLLLPFYVPHSPHAFICLLASRRHLPHVEGRRQETIMPSSSQQALLAGTALPALYLDLPACLPTM